MLSDLTGEVKTFMNEEEPLSEELLSESKVHLMDCMDCHNRPTHIFNPPSSAINESILLGRIDKSLPMIKNISVELFSEDYETTDIAINKIAEAVWNYYKENYPDVFVKQKNNIEQSIRELQKIYQRNIFPEMGVKWSVYPNNIGHLDFPGCFRCHDNKHVNKYGERVTNNCNTCHTIL